MNIRTAKRPKTAADSFAHASEGIRQQMEDQLPLIPRPLADWFTGQPILDGKSHPTRIDPIAYLARDMAIVVAAVGALILILMHAPLVAKMGLVPALWCVIVGRLRKMQTLFGHEAAHGNFFLAGDPRRTSARRVLGLSLNDLLGEIATTFALSQNMAAYRRDHDLHHSARTYTTMDDPDTAVVARVREHYVLHLLNPVEYVADMMTRLRSNLVGVSPLRRAMALGWIGVLLAGAALLPLPVWACAILAPWAIGFRLAGLLQIVSLHAWFGEPVQDVQQYMERTWGRFSGVPLPKRGLRGWRWLTSWTLYWGEMILVELPFRVAVLSDDLQAHDIHHGEWLFFEAGLIGEFVDDWRTQPYRRAEVIAETSDPFGMGQREIWGVRAMMQLAFKLNLR